MEYDVPAVAAQFDLPGVFQFAEPYGNGHINDTFAATYEVPDGTVRYIIQRINHNVFRTPIAVMENVGRVTRHTREKLIASGAGDVDRRTLTLLPTHDGQDYHQDDEGNVWRACVFIEAAHTYETIRSTAQAYEAARAFGYFQGLLADLTGPRLNETIPGFHHTRRRFDTFGETVAADPLNRAAAAAPEIEFALGREALADVLLDLHAAGEIPERVTHNDTKLNNVMIDDASGEGICVIDLDTAMPGLTLYDFGDMVRAITSPAAEDEPDLSKVAMRMPMFEALASGYLAALGGLLNVKEKELLPFAGKLLTYECGIRFLTDYLAGDVYFKVHRETHNLDRARTHFRLLESIEEQEEDMVRFVAGL